jgi:hypothetical protein
MKAFFHRLSVAYRAIQLQLAWERYEYDLTNTEKRECYDKAKDAYWKAKDQASGIESYPMVASSPI